MSDNPGRFRLYGDENAVEWELINPDGYAVAASTSATEAGEAQRHIEWIKANAADCTIEWDWTPFDRGEPHVRFPGDGTELIVRRARPGDLVEQPEPVGRLLTIR